MIEDYAKLIQQGLVSVVEINSAIVGVLVLSVTDEGLLLDNVAVEPSSQRKGIGKYLLKFAEAEARRQGYHSIFLYTHEKMTENQSLYARIGYVEYDRRVDMGFSRVYMRKLLQ
jgi:ribosomal protein S18 acetylase RimI-like enzyme